MSSTDLTEKDSSDMPAWQRLHHIGFVVAAISDVVEQFARATGTRWDGQIIHDPVQLVRVSFLAGASTDEPLLELVEPAAAESPVRAFLSRGGGLHHLCYEVGHLEMQIERVRATGGLILCPPMSGIVFGGRRLTWVYTAQRFLLEYVER